MKIHARTTVHLSRLVLGLLLTAAVLNCAPSATIRDLKPTVILISLDGFRYDYLEKHKPPNLLKLASEGVRAKWMTPSFPSKTFPNHYTIVTGLYPQDNGIVENTIYDPQRNVTFGMSNREEVQNGRWWLGEPIWVTAEKQGQKTAPMFWPGSEAEIEGTHPTYWRPYDSKITNEQRVDDVLAYLDRPIIERPTFLTLYFSDVDNAGHDYGPEAEETRSAVLKVDSDLARLFAGLKNRGIYDQVNVIVVSDHGMAPQSPNNVIILDELFDVNLAEKVLWTSEITSIFPKSGQEQAIYDTLRQKLPPEAKVYRKSELPARFHYSNSPRIPALLVLPQEGWTLMTRAKYEENKSKERKSAMRGGHGYDNELPSMRAIFIGHGAAFRKGVTVEAFENIQVYNVMARILSLKPAPNDGNDQTATAVLRN